MTVHFRKPTQIEVPTEAHAEAWAAEFGVSVHSLLTAMRTVGTDAEAVGQYLAAFREPMGAYVDQMKARLDEIEVLVERLGEERRSIVSFLEGFAQLQRTQRNQRMHAAAGSTGADLYTLTVTAEGGSVQDRRDGGVGSPPVRDVYRAPQGSSAEIGDTVYRLLADGRRRSLHEILSFLEVRGIAAKGANPSAFLSTLLSRDERFDPNRRDGWGLKGRP
ncbi:DUF3606 domain-containing protein [Luteibacter aegosomatissinici]|uniref:DUF3606 domain-containing protein n=1 Tax=Luteibacter aegosomatissinici TaxID=2911539 RepID=UPI001FFB1AE0|nr:DUF3606 domain-containing protein [Luteibacter aegosomatissinici]UPG92821.1 DUF3606 domain-containing protein [Luteibacter aegosomatissinici]